MYRMECVRVETLVSGQMDCADFAKRLSENRDKPAIVNVNIGKKLLTFLLHISGSIDIFMQNGSCFCIYCFT
jgi:hypothetical protein